MKEDKKRQTSENFILGAFLAAAGGFLDAYTYLVRGKVFANAQTGNIVLLGVELASGRFAQASRYIIPVLAFAGGVLLTELLKHKMRDNKLLHWRQIIILAEIILLFSASFVPSGKYDIAVNTIISFVCAMQVEGFKVISGSRVATTMCTGNLRSATETFFNAVIKKDKNALKISLTYSAIILIFIVGAALGALLTNAFGIKSIYAPCLLLVPPFIMMFRREL